MRVRPVGSSSDLQDTAGELHATPVFDNTGKVSQIITLARDVTPVVHQQQKLDALHQAAGAVADADDGDPDLAVAASAGGALGAGRASGLLLRAVLAHVLLHVLLPGSLGLLVDVANTLDEGDGADDGGNPAETQDRRD